MRFINPIPFVRDINRSREFYEKRLGLKVLEEFEHDGVDAAFKNIAPYVELIHRSNGRRPKTSTPSCFRSFPRRDITVEKLQL